jgi:hypothetical protein
MTIIFILPLAKKYYQNPTITTIGSTNYPVWQVLKSKLKEFNASTECISSE